MAMKVKAGKYTYLWTGDEPLVPGDLVLLPENWVSRMIHGPGPFEDTVTEIGSDYDGAVSRVIRKVGHDPTWKPPEPARPYIPKVSLVHEARYKKQLDEFDRQIAEWRERVGGSASDSLTVERVRRVACPKCGAAESHPCVNGAKPRLANHQERVRRFRDWMDEIRPRYPSRPSPSL
jgi:hypothetical protein